MPNQDTQRLPAFCRRLATLRWWLIGGLTCAVLSALTFLEIVLPTFPLLALLLLMAAFNLIVSIRARRDEIHVVDLATQLTVDLVAMGVLLFLTGGATNPLVSLLLLPVAVAAFALPAPWVAGITLLATGLYSVLMRYSLPLPIADVERATRLHLGGMWLTFVVSAALLAWFVTRMTQALQAREAQLMAAREKALRDAQVVALGQLAAGAAHELGTPLATMHILAGELRNDARLPQDARTDIDLLCQQVMACKQIIGGLTQKAGIERAPQPIPADDWLTGLLTRWRILWPQASCALSLAADGPPPRIIADAALEQGILNLLNNAAKVTPAEVSVKLAWTDQVLRVEVHDRGPGFPPEILSGCGAQPVPATAGGSGIGLWLTRAAVERRGGRLQLRNEHGGVALLEIPLGAHP